MIFNLTNAIHSLYPNTIWSIRGDDYATLNWLDSQVDKPSESVLRAEVARLQSEWDAAEYRRLRAAAYPPIGDQLDAIIKWLDTQEVTPELQGIIDWCKEVKNKYPKGGA